MRAALLRCSLAVAHCSTLATFAVPTKPGHQLEAVALTGSHSPPSRSPSPPTKVVKERSHASGKTTEGTSQASGAGKPNAETGSPSQASDEPAMKQYMGHDTNHPNRYQLIRIHKAKSGDHATGQAFHHDPNMIHEHAILSSVSDADGAHKDMLQFRNTHKGIRKAAQTFYKTDNHLGFPEEHERVFLKHNEKGHPIVPDETKGEKLHPFEHLSKGLEKHKGVPALLHVQSPVSLHHLEKVGEAAKASGVNIEAAHLSKGHNSQQPGPMDGKLAGEHNFMTNARNVIQKHHPGAKVMWTGDNETYDKHKGGLNVDRHKMKDLLHPSHLATSSEDMFFGPSAVTLEKQVQKYSDPKWGGPPVREALPPNYKEKGYTLPQAVSHMRTERDKSPESVKMVQKGLKHYVPFLDETQAKLEHMKPIAEEKKLDDAFHIGKRLDRLRNPENYRKQFKEGADIQIESADPMSLAGLRQAKHNVGSSTGPHFKPIKWATHKNRVVSTPGTEHDNHGHALVNVNSNEAMHDHRLLVKGGSDRAWKEDETLKQSKSPPASPPQSPSPSGKAKTG